MRKKFLGFVPLLGVIAFFSIYSTTWSLAQLSSPSSLTLDLSAPDVLIRSNSLSQLPADLLRIPLLQDLLSEDFLFYYEHSEGRYGLGGTIRRIAYEHNVGLTDELIKLVMDEPADVAIWRGSKGELKYYAIAMTRGNLAKMLQPLALIAMKDRQLSLIGETHVADERVQIFALEYAWRQKMLIATHHDRVLVLSDPAMILNPDGTLTASANHLLQDLLGPDKHRQQRFAADFALEESANEHSMAFKTNFLSFYYQHFFPTLKALRFDFGKKSAVHIAKKSTAIQSPLESPSWSTAMLLELDPAQSATDIHRQTLWQALPYQAGACVNLPTNWHVVARTMSNPKIADGSVAPLSSLFSGPIGMCWYATSRLHTPLFVAELNAVDNSDAILEKYFNYGIRQNAAINAEDGSPIKAFTTNTGDVLWQTEPASNHSQPTLARSNRLVYFSPDAALVNQALAVAHKQHPAVSDGWKNPKPASYTIALVSPLKLAKLAKQEIVLSLPRQQDELLRNAAEQHLLPKLAAVEQYPPMRLDISATPERAGWVELQWQAY